MKIKKLLGMSAVFILGLSTLAACNTYTKTAEGGQVYRFIEKQEMPTADISLATDEVSFTALNNVYEGLYRLDEANQPQPAGAAEKAQVSADGLVYKIQLNQAAQWSDGKPVVASDYVYSWQRTVAPETASEYAYMFASVENAQKITDGEQAKETLGVQALSDYELEITLEQPTPYFDYLLALPTFFPQRQDIVEKYGKDYSTSSEKAVYNGPFTLTDFEGPGSDTSWSYTKNESYWDRDTVQIDQVQVTVVKESPTALNLFQDGQADEVPLSGELAQQMKNDPSYVALEGASTFYLEFNQREKTSPYHNLNLRQAISYAIDREALVTQILANGSKAPLGLIPEGLVEDPNSGEDFAATADNVIAYNPEQAQDSWAAAQAELGISELNLDLLTDDSDNGKKMAEYLQGAIETNLPGVKVTISAVPFTVRLDRSTFGDFQVVVGAWGADYADPSSFLDLFTTNSSNNKGRYSNATYDALMASAATTNANNPQARFDDLLQAENLLMSEMAVAPLYQKAEAHLRAERVQGVVYHSTGAKYDFKWVTLAE